MNNKQLTINQEPGTRNQEPGKNLNHGKDGSLGEELDVLVLKGKGDSIISRMSDGRVILFNRENPIFPDLRPGVMVKSKVRQAMDKITQIEFK